MDRYHAVEVNSVADALARVVAHAPVDGGQRVVFDQLSPGRFGPPRGDAGQPGLDVLPWIVGLTVLDACRDAANRWLFTEAGEAWSGVKDVYVAAASNPTHYVDVTDTIDRGVASLCEHRAYIDGLGGEFDPDQFIRGISEFEGECQYAVTFQRYAVS
jgi:hypothetical protein